MSSLRFSRQDDNESWSETLTYSEKVKIHLARALIMNPEVLVLQRPLQLGNFKHFLVDGKYESVVFFVQVGLIGKCWEARQMQQG